MNDLVQRSDLGDVVTERLTEILERERQRQFLEQASNIAASRAGGSCRCADRSPACWPFAFSFRRISQGAPGLWRAVSSGVSDTAGDGHDSGPKTGVADLSYRRRRIRWLPDLGAGPHHGRPPSEVIPSTGHIKDARLVGHSFRKLQKGGSVLAKGSGEGSRR